MRKINLLIIAIILPHFVIAQDFRKEVGSIIRNEVRNAVRNSRSSDRESSSSSHSSIVSKTYDEYKKEHEREREREWARERAERERERKEKEREAVVIINNMDKLINYDCIDIRLLQNAIDEFNSLPEDLQNIQGVDGHNARAKLMAQKHNMEPIYNKYSLMSTNIRNLSFGGFNTRILSLSYEDLDMYLKQFLNKHDFERAKVEYQKYEKAKVLERDIEALHAHSNDKKYLRENISDVQKLKSVIKQQDALKYVDSYYSFLLDEIEKAIEYDEIKQISLTVSNIKTVLAPKKATKNNANWKEIAGGMTNQRLLSVLGTLNSDNNNILPDYVREEGGYYLFVGEPTETDTKIVTKEYLVSKDGSKIEIYETEGTASIAGESFMDDNERFVNTDLFRREKRDVYEILANGMVNKLGIGASIGVNSGMGASFDNDQGEASIGIGTEASSLDFSIAARMEPVMIVNPDQSVSFKQESKAVGIGGSLGKGVGASISVSSGLHVDTPIVSFSVSKGQPNIDGALKQIDSDVVLGIIKSSIDNEYYTSEFDDEGIGKTVVSSIRKEIEIREQEVEKH